MLVENIKTFQRKHPGSFLLALLVGVLHSKYELLAANPESGVEMFVYNHMGVAANVAMVWCLVGECEQSTEYLQKIYQTLLYDDQKDVSIATFASQFNAYAKYYTQSQSEMCSFITNLMCLAETAGLSLPLVLAFAYVRFGTELALGAEAQGADALDSVFETVAANLSGSEQEMSERMLVELENIFEDDRSRTVTRTLLNSSFKMLAPYFIAACQHAGDAEGRYRSLVVAKATSEVGYAYGDMLTTVAKVMETERALNGLLGKPSTPFSIRESSRTEFTFRKFRCANVACAIKGVTIFTDISFVSDARAVTILKGASGSGKSTMLARMAQRFYDGETAFAGVMRLHAEEATYDLGGAAAAGVVRANSFCYMGNVGLFSHGTVRENFRLYLKREDDVLLRQVLAKVGLLEEDALLGKRAFQLSMGQQQRVLIAFMLASEKPLYFLDEPLSHLNDALAQRCAKEIIKHVRNQGACLIVVDHTSTFETLRHVPKQVVNF